MKRGDKVLVPTGDPQGSTVEGVIASVDDDGFAMCTVPAGSMHMGRRATKALRRVADLEAVGGKPKAAKKTTKKKASKKAKK